MYSEKSEVTVDGGPVYRLQRKACSWELLYADDRFIKSNKLENLKKLEA